MVSSEDLPERYTVFAGTLTVQTIRTILGRTSEKIP
jgi:hypothetical protein